MARCGCTSQCSCAVQAGDGVAVTGTGATGNPYVISATGGALQVNDSPTVDLTLAGSGSQADPHILSAAAKISATAGNLLVAMADGLAVTCESVQDCIGNALGLGLVYDDANNLISALISGQAGNSLAFGVDGGLFAPTGGGNPVTVQDTACISLAGDGVGAPLAAVPIIDPAANNLLQCGVPGLLASLNVGPCGLTGNGSPASPIAARVAAWPFACPVDANSTDVYCDSAGQLAGPPRYRMAVFYNGVNTTGLNVLVDASFGGAVVATASLNVTNPDPCRPAQAIVFVEADIDFLLPVGASAAQRVQEEYSRFFNNGSNQQTAHNQVSRFLDNGGPIIPAGAAQVINVDIAASLGVGGARYTRVQWRMLVMLFSLDP